MYGLREWNAAKGNDVKLIGGTFTLRNLSSPLAQTHTALARALRLATYTHVSLLLEQHFLRDSGVSLRFAPRPKPRLISFSTTGAAGAPPPPLPTPQSEVVTPGARKNKTFLPGILSFFSKKNQSLGLGQQGQRQARSGGSLDLSAVVSRLSSDGGEARGRRSFSSFLGPSPPSSGFSATSGASVNSNPSALTSPASTTSTSTVTPATAGATATGTGENGKGLGGDGTTFPALLALLTRAAPLLSASPTVRFEPPAVVVRLAAKEAEFLAHHDAKGGGEVSGGGNGNGNGNGNGRKRRLRGDERVGLGSVLGWDAGAGEAREARARGRGMVGARGFARMQELSVLVSRHVPCPGGGEGGKGGTGTVGVKGSATALSASASSAVALAVVGEQHPHPGGGEREHHSLAPCGRPHPTTFQYYSHNAGAGAGSDRSLGVALERMAGDAGGACRRCAEGCAWREGEHVGRIVHGGVRVRVCVREVEVGSGEDAPASEREHGEGGGASEGGEEKGGGGGDGRHEKGTSAASGVSKAGGGNTVKKKGAGGDDAKEGEKIRMWASCAVCGAETPRVEMSDGTYSSRCSSTRGSRPYCVTTPRRPPFLPSADFAFGFRFNTLASPVHGGGPGSGRGEARAAKGDQGVVGGGGGSFGWAGNNHRRVPQGAAAAALSGRCVL
ncbi:hypothetical protein B0H14DRAFT_581057 [Mycena olivaceomarginata]|nr:hypothetical protein B0H14DRAFT_581057 [Mycena olivaceomarginata]